MSHSAAWVLGVISALAPGDPQAPVVWSPDGRWVTHTAAVRPVSALPAPGWLFETGPVPGKPGARPAEGTGPGISARRPPAIAFRIWATRADSGASVLLAESPGPLTSPAWSPDGKALAFGRIVRDDDGRARFEVVIQDAPDGRRVIAKQPCDEPATRGEGLPASTLAWSPDGRYLVIPVFQQTMGLAIIRADNGRPLKVVDDARLPAWSPDGTKLAFLRGRDQESLHYLDTNFGPPRHLADFGPTSQAPSWHKRSILLLTSQRGQAGMVPQGTRPALFRVPIDGGRPELVSKAGDAGDAEKACRGASFSFDPDRDNLFYTDDVDGEPSIVTWFRLRTKETYKRDNPIEFSVRVGSLAISPSGKTLAFRAGMLGDFPPPGLWDLESNRFTPIVPDVSARVEWVATVIAGAKQLLRTYLPAAVGPKGQPVERASLLPIPGEVPHNNELAVRLRRLGRLGRPICDRPADAPPPDPAVAAFLDEARLFFDYLREDYTAALASLESLEARMTSPGPRLRLLSVRAQIFLGQGQEESAEQTIAYLQSLEREAPRRLEITPAGTTLTEEEAPTQGWAKYLDSRARLLRASAGTNRAEPSGHQQGNTLEAAPGPFGPFGPQDFEEIRNELPVLIGDVELPPDGDARFLRRKGPLPPPERVPLPRPRRAGPLPGRGLPRPVR